MKPAFVTFLAVTLFANVVRAELETNIEYGNGRANQVLRLDANVPDGTGPFPVVIAIHGGGWCSRRQKWQRRFRTCSEGVDRESFHLVFD